MQLSLGPKSLDVAFSHLDTIQAPLPYDLKTFLCRLTWLWDVGVG
jgi:hypothetical protein